MATAKKQKGLSDEIVEKLAAIGITAKDEADAEKKVKKILTDNEIDEDLFEDQSLTDLIEMAESFVESESDDDAEEADDDDAEEAEEAGDDEEEEEEAPKKKPAKAVTTTPVKKADKSAAKKEKKAKAEKKRLTAFDSSNDAHVAKLTKLLKKPFPSSKFEVKITKQGATIRAIGKNASIPVACVHSVKFDGDAMFAGFFGNRFKNLGEMIEFLPESIQEKIENEDQNKNYQYGVINLSEEELAEVLASDAVTEGIKRATQKDTKLGSARAELEKKIESQKASTKKAAAKAEEEEEEAEEEEEEAPAPKKKAVVTKKSAKK